MDYFLPDGLGGFLGTVAQPATSPYVIAVGALTSRFVPDNPRSFIDLGKIAYFSSRGPTRDGRLKPEVVAPGYFVLGPEVGTSDYILEAGTSMASPVVAGLVALILEENPNLDVDGVRGILSSQALSDGFTGSLPNNIYGYGKAFLSSFSSGSGRWRRRWGWWMQQCQPRPIHCPACPCPDCRSQKENKKSAII
jgi:subtilisin family serine protease